MVISPMGIGTKHNCAGEDQQQFSRQSVGASVGGRGWWLAVAKEAEESWVALLDAATKQRVVKK
jgi:hypothetical protein